MPSAPPWPASASFFTPVMRPEQDAVLRLPGAAG